ncbi:response regulator transcription factor [Microlunatus aurantiacus]|uniref:Response regulator transcription factor n=1 Tax=Microlunatus aurantiacus TaxID=446786 RepID=A0ABP7DL05_9ACTN
MSTPVRHPEQVSGAARTAAADGGRPAPDSPRILLVEDDRTLAGMLEEILGSAGYAVEVAYDGQLGLHLGLSHRYDVMVLDRGLPALEGLDLLGRLRSRGVLTPVLVLSALGLARDRVDGLDAGAEDYLSKPFDIDELLARLRALLRRHHDRADDLPVPGGRLVVSTRTVTTDDGAGTFLSERECALLAVLARRPARVFTRSELVAAVFPDADDDGVVDTYVHYLRRKLSRNAIRTVRGLGYQLGSD